MKEIGKFLVDYWDVISVVLSMILLTLTFILNRFRVKLNLPVTSYTSIIQFIKEAEEIFGSGNGDKKCEYVVQKYLKENNISKVFQSAVRGFVEDIIEEVLECPQKHEKSHD